MEETTPQFKVGDKVVYNEDGKAFNKKTYTNINLNEVVYGIVVYFRKGTHPLVTLDLYNHKGIKVESHWCVYAEHLEYYEDN